MKKIVLGVILSLMLCGLNYSNAFADSRLDEETENSKYSRLDEYGNEIDWDIEDVGNEEGAGSEGEYVPINADLLDSERLDQNESEAESIADVINQNRTNESEVENGTVSLKFVVPDKWRGNNIVVSLYNKDLWKSFDVYIYKQNDFEGQEELPCGEYEIRGAAVVGDINGVYPLLVNANGKMNFKLKQGGEKIAINVELAGNNDYIIKEKETEKEREGVEINEIKQETALEKTTKEFLWDNMFFVVLFVVGLVGFTLYKKRKNEEKET